MTERSPAKRAANSGKRQKLDDTVAASFVFSTRDDGAVQDWSRDNALGVVLGPTFSKICEQIVRLIERNTGWSLGMVDGGKPMRVHLIRNGQTIGIISGWRAGDVIAAPEGVAIKGIKNTH